MDDADDTATMMALLRLQRELAARRGSFPRGSADWEVLTAELDATNEEILESARGAFGVARAFDDALPYPVETYPIDDPAFGREVQVAMRHAVAVTRASRARRATYTRITSTAQRFVEAQRLLSLAETEVRRRYPGAEITISPTDEADENERIIAHRDAEVA
ncbi:MAG: hypothetical protein ACJ761_00070 [Chloroflexota bacterium]